MKKISQHNLDTLSNYLKNVKFRGHVQTLRLELQEDEHGHFIYIGLINVKKQSMNRGIGTSIINEIVDLANNRGYRVKLWATCVYGSNLSRLIEFYGRFGFVSSGDCEMVYDPKIKDSNIVKT